MKLLYTDPLPHLTQDTVLWTKVLRGTAYLKDQEKAVKLLKSLWQFRALGTLLRPSTNGLVLVPVIIPDGAWLSENEFEQSKLKYLKPYAMEIKWLLDRAEGRVT